MRKGEAWAQAAGSYGVRALELGLCILSFGSIFSFFFFSFFFPQK